MAPGSLKRCFCQRSHGLCGGDSTAIIWFSVQAFYSLPLQGTDHISELVHATFLLISGYGAFHVICICIQVGSGVFCMEKIHYPFCSVPHFSKCHLQESSLKKGRENTGWGCVLKYEQKHLKGSEKLYYNKESCQALPCPVIRKSIWPLKFFFRKL